MPWVETEFEEEFRQFIENFSIEEVPIILALLEKYQDKTIIIFNSREEVNRYIRELKLL